MTAHQSVAGLNTIMFFSGYTLADIYKIKDWNHDEKSEFYQWISQDTQKLQIKTSHRRLVDNQHQLSVKQYSDPDALYPSLQIRLQALTLRKASAEQWLSTINNMQQSGKMIISKQQIINNINFKNIRLELSVEEIPKTLNRLGKIFNCNVSKTSIEPRDPWINLDKSG